MVLCGVELVTCRRMCFRKESISRRRVSERLISYRRIGVSISAIYPLLMIFTTGI